MNYKIKPYADLTGADLRDADLMYAYLRGADLRDVNISYANLTGVYLRDADLRRADLRGVNISYANLSNADLTGADLSYADLRRADLRNADLRGVNISYANLSNADLTGADLTGANFGFNLEEIKISNLDSKILDAIQSGGVLEMSKWHSCETTHCRAGWAIYLAGEVGVKLQEKFGPAAAGSLIYFASTNRVPDFFTTNEKAMADIVECASAEKKEKK